MNLTTKKWGQEISWTFGSCASAQLYANQQQYTERCCQTSGEYTLTCKDSNGDGWHGGFMEIEGNKYCYGFLDGSEATEKISISGIYTLKCFGV